VRRIDVSSSYVMVGMLGADVGHLFRLLERIRLRGVARLEFELMVATPDCCCAPRACAPL
jgi:hypothetical protein